MSDIHYINVRVSGPNAAAAEKAAREHQFNDAHNTYNESTKDGLGFIGRWDGDAVVEYIKKLSAAFTTEAFDVHVNGPAGCWEKFQGNLQIRNGVIVRNEPYEDQAPYGEMQPADPDPDTVR